MAILFEVKLRRYPLSRIVPFTYPSPDPLLDFAIPTNHRGRVFGGYVGIGEVVRQVFDRLLIEGVNVRVKVHGRQVETILLGFIKIRAVAIEAHGEGATR